MPFLSLAASTSLFSRSISSVYSCTMGQSRCNLNLAQGLMVTHLNECFLRQLLVDLWSVGDILSPVGVVKGGEGLFKVALSR